MSSVAIIDYGMGNLHSVASALHRVAPDVDVQVTADHEVVKRADRVIFPGVGAIRDCMAEIRRLGFDKLVADEIASGKPLLAICVGMQALMQRSEENGGIDCLGHFDGSVEFFSNNDVFQASSAQSKLKVPHMGWNQVEQVLDHPMWQGIENNCRFYFVHSYFVHLQQQGIESGRSHYGLGFTTAVAKGNVFATQFHPEKSHDAGLQLLKNFVAWDGKF
ncbi:imidazole glycerol phosphate synthase subunit HisH [Agaribacterium sp. ZY112]|uniref:imidazole glycerol phosphate synthase subunit HisH n=1 Tax=Agaribacterium sp. ZY112 TaxID=3233574 RepID=UPI0035240C57